MKKEYDVIFKRDGGGEGYVVLPSFLKLLIWFLREGRNCVCITVLAPGKRGKYGNIKTSKAVEFDVIYDDGTRRRVKEGVLYEAEESGDMIFHNGTNRLEVLTAAAETALVSLHAIGPGLEVLALGMAISDESRDALVCLAKFANDLLNTDSAEKQACFRLGQKDMQAAVVDMLISAGENAGGVVGATLTEAADMVRKLEVEGHDEK